MPVPDLIQWLITEDTREYGSQRWRWEHVNYDGPGDDRCGTGPTWEDCVRQIEDQEKS